MNRDQGRRFANVSAPLMESLEVRRMLSHTVTPPYSVSRHHTLVIEGTRHGTSLVVTTSGRRGKFIDVAINGTTYLFRTTALRQIVFIEHSGRDTAVVQKHLPIPCHIVGFTTNGNSGGGDGGDTGGDSGGDSGPGGDSGGGPVDTGGGDTPVDPTPTPPVDSGGGNGGDSGGSPAPADPGAPDGGEGFEGTGGDFPSGGDDDSFDASTLVIARARSFAGVFRA